MASALRAHWWVVAAVGGCAVYLYWKSDNGESVQTGGSSWLATQGNSCGSSSQLWRCDAWRSLLQQRQQQQQQQSYCLHVKVIVCTAATLPLGRCGGAIKDIVRGAIYTCPSNTPAAPHRLSCSNFALVCLFISLFAGWQVKIRKWQWQRLCARAKWHK